MAGLVDGFGRDFEGLVPKMNQYLMCTIHDIYIGMNEPGWKVSNWECLSGRGRVLAIDKLNSGRPHLSATRLEK